MFDRMKQYFITNLNCYKHNLYGYFCPNCFLVQTNPTAFLETIWDEKYRKYKMYIRCNKCYTTTPAFENIEKVQDIWEDLLIDKEIEMFEEEGD